MFPSLGNKCNSESGRENNKVPGMVALLGSGAEGDADVADALGTDAGAASHHLIQVYLHLLVVRQLSVHPVSNISHHDQRTKKQTQARKI